MNMTSQDNITKRLRFAHRGSCMQTLAIIFLATANSAIRSTGQRVREFVSYNVSVPLCAVKSTLRAFMVRHEYCVELA